MLDKAGNPIDHYLLSESKALSGDQLNANVTWKKETDLSALMGKEVKLRFYLKGGDLYSYWFNPQGVLQKNK